ncbi:MAG: hypothetical protein HKN43_15560 [Rhodothermales bacterium]|nr:hypothetical protein [Rhodothermales bacterium]
MKKAVTTIGLFLILAVGTYVYLLASQISDVDEVCALFPEGAVIGNLKEIEDNYSLKLMGPFAVRNKSDTQEAVFCASLTLCDTSCSVEYRNGRVTKAEVRRL